MTIPKQKFITKIIYDYKNIDENELIQYINKFDYENHVFCLPFNQQAEAFTKILTDAIEKFVPTKKITIKPADVPWQNSYTRLLMRKKNRNYQIFKKINSDFLAVTAQPNSTPELITRLKTKKEKAFAKCKSASNESTKANRRAKQAFFHSVNSTMHNSNVSAKKEI